MANSTSDFLFQGTPPSAWTSSLESTSTMPDWWQAAAQGLISRASQIAAQPFPVSPAPKVAPLDPLQQDVYNKANAYAPSVNNKLNSAADMTTQAGELFNPNDFSKFMNPYTENVVNDIATLGNRNLMENVLPGINDTFVRSGQGIGGSRNQDFTLRALRDNQQTISQQQDQALNQGFQNSMSNYQTGQTNLANAGQDLGKLATSEQALSQGQLGLENAIGGQNQQSAQKSLDAANTDFQNQATYPLQMLNQLSGMIRGYQPQADVFKYGTSPIQGSGAPSPLQSITSGLAGLYGGQPNNNGQ